MKNNLPKLEEKIYSLVPELKELTFWCWVKTYLWNWDRETHFRFVYKTYKSNIIVCENNDDDQVLIWEHDYTIIGHEIFPHHWLPLLEKHSLTYYGHLMKWDNWDVNEATYKYLDIIYDFKKPLSEQSEELRQFLFDNL